MEKRELLWVCLALLTPALHGCFPAVVAAGGAAVVMVDDRRSSGTYVEDKTIGSKVSRRINEKYGDEVHVDVIPFNRFVVLVGEAPNQQIKDDIGAIALGVENVRNVQNEITIGPVTSSGTRANDAYLTSKVTTNFTTAGKFDPVHVKVVTEDGVVYLMGLVKHKEGEDAAEIASTTGGVKKVVKVFEYLD
jgi:osmotically-inducible protein OsmY